MTRKNEQDQIQKWKNVENGEFGAWRNRQPALYPRGRNSHPVRPKQPTDYFVSSTILRENDTDDGISTIPFRIGVEEKTTSRDRFSMSVVKNSSHKKMIEFCLKCHLVPVYIITFESGKYVNKYSYIIPIKGFYKEHIDREEATRFHEMVPNLIEDVINAMPVWMSRLNLYVCDKDGKERSEG